MAIDKEALRGVFPNPSQREIDVYSYFLAERIMNSGFIPDLLVAVRRGGEIPAKYMSSYIYGAPVAGITVIKDGEKRRIAEDSRVDWSVLKGKKAVVVEDMLESGKSGQAAVDFLRGKGVEARLACFFTVPETEVTPDYVLATNVEIDVHFHWEK
jgi:hypoxanthine phosphoribosyltransferase